MHVFIYSKHLYLKLYSLLNTWKDTNTVHPWPVCISTASYTYNMPSLANPVVFLTQVMRQVCLCIPCLQRYTQKYCFVSCIRIRKLENYNLHTSLNFGINNCMHFQLSPYLYLVLLAHPSYSRPKASVLTRPAAVSPPRLSSRRWWKPWRRKQPCIGAIGKRQW